jgi:cobalt-zinc-cadmium efflux system protein
MARERTSPIQTALDRPGMFDELVPEKNVHHNHDHRHSRSTESWRKLSIVLGLTSLYMIAEVLGGWWTGSLALLADAGHMFTDVAALILALTAVWFASRPATSKKTFGYYRLEIIAALVNGVALVVIALLIIYGAYERWLSPPIVRSGPMMLVAAGGLFVNLWCAYILHSRHEIDLNMRGAWLHVIGDALGSVAAILAAACMMFFGWYAADPLFSIIISLLIIWGSVRLIRESRTCYWKGHRHISTWRLSRMQFLLPPASVMSMIFTFGL